MICINKQWSFPNSWSEDGTNGDGLYTNLSNVNRWPIDNSDYIPIEASGYVCINAYNRSAINRNHYYRNDTDIPSILDIDLLTSVTILTNKSSFTDFS